MRHQALMDAGFERLPSLGSEAWVKEQRVQSLPHAREYLVNGGLIAEDMFAQTTLTNGWVELVIPAADYREGPAQLSSDWGQSLLHDAMAVPFDQAPR